MKNMTNAEKTEHDMLNTEIYDSLSRKASAVLVFHLFILSCKNMLVATIPAVNGVNSILNGIITVILLMLYFKVFVFDYGYRRITVRGFLFLNFVILFLIVSFIFDQNLFVCTEFPYNYVRSEFIKFLTYSLPMFLIMLIIRDYRPLTEILYKYSFILFIFATLGIVGTIVFPASHYSNAAAYSMSFGNAVLLYTMIAIIRFHEEHKLSVLVGGLLSIGYILLDGSRGPLVSIGLMIIYLFIIKAKKAKERLFALILVMIMLLFFFFYKEILQFLIISLEHFNLSSRTLIYAMNSSLTYDSGRQEYYEIIYKALSDSPILGLGAFGGEALVGLTHSLYVDIFANFGYIFGSFYIIVMVFGSLKTAYKYRNTNVEQFIMLLFITCFPRGFFNDSFWTARELWMLMGILMGCICYFSYVGADKNEKN